MTTPSPTPPGAADGTPGGPRRWTHWPFRITISVAAVLLFDQAVFAGQFLSGTFGAVETHHENAQFAGITVLVAAATAVLIRWPGNGPIWPALACLGLFGLIALQIALGFARTLTVHVPLGISIILLAVLLAIWAWRRTDTVSRTGGRLPASEEGESA